MKNEEGNLITSEAEAINIWRKKGLMNVQEYEARHEYTNHRAEPLVEQPTVEEVSRGIHNLPNIERSANTNPLEKKCYSIYT